MKCFEKIFEIFSLFLFAGCRVPESGIAGVFSLPDAGLPETGKKFFVPDAGCRIPAYEIFMPSSPARASA